jgi:hypothetical protein
MGTTVLHTTVYAIKYNRPPEPRGIIQ